MLLIVNILLMEQKIAIYFWLHFGPDTVLVFYSISFVTSNFETR